MSSRYVKVWLVIAGTVAGMTLTLHAAYPSAGRARSTRADDGLSWRAVRFVDDSIPSRVRIALGWHYNVSVMPTVRAKGSIVTLTGEAASIVERDLTTTYVRDVEGVTAVRNEMTVAGSN